MLFRSLRFETEYEINFALLEEFKEFFHSAADDVQTNTWILFGEFVDSFRKNRRKSVGNADIENSGQHLLEVANLCKTEFGVLQGPLCNRQQMLSALGKRYRVRIPLQQFDSQFLFQTAYLLGKGALGYEQCSGGFGEIESFCRLYKVFQLSEFHLLVFEVSVMSQSLLNAHRIIQINLFLPAGSEAVNSFE